jgi:carboxyl-terminal processing protease
VGTTDWESYDIVLDVPQNTNRIVFGFLLVGRGKTWVDDMTVTVVSSDVPVTDMLVANETAVNLDFETADEEGIAGWQIMGSKFGDYHYGLDQDVVYAGSSSGTIRSETAVSPQNGILLQNIDITPFQGQSIQFSALIKTENVTDRAFMQLELFGQSKLLLDDMFDRPITGATDWTPYTIVLEPDEKTTNAFVIIYLLGSGQLWVDNVTIAAVDQNTPLTGAYNGQNQQQLVFDDLWHTVNTVYVYPDFNGVDWDEVRQIYQAQIDEDLSDEQFWAAMDEMIALLDDDHSDFLSPAEAAENDALHLGEPGVTGIGVMAFPVPDLNLEVVSYVFPGSPAEAAGIQQHDRLIAADGQPVCCNQDGESNGVIRGQAGTAVSLTVETPGQPPREVEIIRAAFKTDITATSRLLENQIGYIYVPILSYDLMGEAVQSAWKTLNETEPVSGLILDLRMNSGGFDTELIEILSLFVDGTLGSFHSHENERPLSIQGSAILGSQTVPLVVLISDKSNSYAEVLSGTLKEAGRAILVGVSTKGNVETYYQYNFADGSRAHISQEIFVPSSGTTWNGVGVQPDVEVIQAWHDFASDGEDEALQTAVSILLGE